MHATGSLPKHTFKFDSLFDSSTTVAWNKGCTSALLSPFRRRDRSCTETGWALWPLSGNAPCTATDRALRGGRPQAQTQNSKQAAWPAARMDIMCCHKHNNKLERRGEEEEKEVDKQEAQEEEEKDEKNVANVCCTSKQPRIPRQRHTGPYHTQCINSIETQGSTHQVTSRISSINAQGCSTRTNGTHNRAAHTRRTPPASHAPAGSASRCAAPRPRASCPPCACTSPIPAAPPRCQPRRSASPPRTL